MRKYLFRTWHYSVLDCRAAAEFLNDMAAGGYRLKSFSGCKLVPDVACFERDENACRLQYAVDANLQDYGDALERYYTVYRDSGWRLVSVYRERLHIFVSEKGTAAPLYTDQQTEWAALAESARLDGAVGKNLLRGFLWVLLLAFFLWKAQSLTVLVALVYGGSALAALSALYCFGLAWGNRRFLRACRKLEAQGLPLPEKKSPSRINALLSLLVMPLFSFWVFGAVYYDYTEATITQMSFSSQALLPFYATGFLFSMAVFFGGLYANLTRPEMRGTKFACFAGYYIWIFLLFSIPFVLYR